MQRSIKLTSVALALAALWCQPAAAQFVSGSVNTGAPITTSNTTASTSPTTGSMIAGGGLGVAGALYVGGGFKAQGLDSGSGAAPVLFSGTTTGLRFFTTAGVSASIEATDQSGVASFQPLKIGGLSLNFQASQVSKLDYGVTTAATWTAAAPFALNGTLNQFGAVAGAPAHIASGQATAPALTSCGTGSPAISGTDTAGTVTMGTTATGCVITFNVAYVTAPHCNVTWRATPLLSQSYAVSNTAITLTQTATTGDVADYFCVAPSGG